MQVRTDHTLGTEVALAKLQKFAVDLPDEYKRNISNLTITWVDHMGYFRFKIAGMSIGGYVNVMNNQILADVKIPIGIQFLKGQIEKSIKEKILQILHRF